MRNKIQWSHHDNKQAARLFVMPKKPIKSGAIMLPAGDCQDLKLFTENRIFRYAPKDSVLLIEKDIVEFRQMTLNVPPLPCFRCIHGSLEKLVLNSEIDFAYLDFLGGLSEPICIWLKDVLSDHIRPGATIGISQILASRGSKILPKYQKKLLQADGREVRRVFQNYDHRIQTCLLLLKDIFQDWDFDIEVQGPENEIPIYSDLIHKMILFKLIDFRRIRKPLFSSRST